ncbi:MAG: histidine ammonia-lyase [Actinomycetota bacterium]|nr:histidine ammonia-lyase [Actinomycetota bacterium]
MTVFLGDPLTFEDVAGVATGHERVELAPSLDETMARARSVVDRAVDAERAVYGITTGIGDLANVRIAPADATRLQRDLVRSHATAVGDPLEEEVVRAMMLLKARTFSFGMSGVRPALVEQIVKLLNARIHPVVPSQGSLGASGDLAPLAHLALPLIGEGRVHFEGHAVDSSVALEAAGVEPLELSYKEGLSLINGTEMMLALGILTLLGAESLARSADITAAMTLEACLGTDRAFDEDLIKARKQPGAHEVAANMRSLLDKSEIVASHRESEHLVQDAYSLRCTPQVHGAYRDGFAYVRSVLEAELASAIDNPTVLAERGEVLSGGNFHGESLALALDHLGLCVAGFATISERRVARLVDPDLNNGLPAFLTTDPGRRSGFMLTQYTAASLVSENRSLCWPASSDSIPTSAGQEDHVSMGATSARKARSILKNTQHVIAVEALCAAQGLDLRAPLQPAVGTDAARRRIRKVSPYLDDDRTLATEIGDVAGLIRDGELARAVEEEGVALT